MAEEKARNALTAMEVRRQAQGQQLIDKLADTKSEEMIRIEAVEKSLRGRGDALKEAIETGDRTNRMRSDELHMEIKRMEDKLKMSLADAQMEDSSRVYALLQEAQEQVKAQACRLRDTTDSRALSIYMIVIPRGR